MAAVPPTPVLNQLTKAFVQMSKNVKPKQSFHLFNY